MHLALATSTWGGSCAFLLLLLRPLARGPAELADIGGGGRGCALREAAGQKWSTQSLRLVS